MRNQRLSEQDTYKIQLLLSSESSEHLAKFIPCLLSHLQLTLWSVMLRDVLEPSFSSCRITVLRHMAPPKLTTAELAPRSGPAPVGAERNFLNLLFQ